MSDLSYEKHNPILNFNSVKYTPKIIVSTIGLLLCGALNTILFKVQTKNLGLSRDSISVQTFITFIGQYLNLIIFYTRISIFSVKRRTHFRKYKNRALMSGKLYEFSSYRIGAAAMLNCGASLTQLYALVALSPSYFQMLLGCGIIFTPLISYFVLKKKIYRHTLIGIIISSISLILISLTSLILKDMNEGQSDNENSLFAVMLMIVGVFLTSAQRVYEEWLLDKIETSAFRFVGLEGFYGISCLFFVHVFFYVYDKVRHIDFFNIGLEFAEVYQNTPLIVTSLILILSTTFYDLFGIVITRKVSATYRVVNDVARVILVWLAEIVLYDIQNPNINKLTYFFVTILRLFSYALLILGNILINEIKEITIWGLDKYFGRYQAAKIDENLLDESEEYSIYTITQKKHSTYH